MNPPKNCIVSGYGATATYTEIHTKDSLNSYHRSAILNKRVNGNMQCSAALCSMAVLYTDLICWCLYNGIKRFNLTKNSWSSQIDNDLCLFFKWLSISFFYVVYCRLNTWIILKNLKRNEKNQAVVMSLF